jgi:uncharacterized protein YecT (DUF1311 family)
MEEARQYSAVRRSGILAFAILAAGLSAARVQAQDATGACSTINPGVVRSCMESRIERKERLMSHLFAQARRSVARNFARYGSNDNRSDPKFLDASQAAWKQWVDSNCTVIAAYNGGSNSATSDRIANCYEGELNRRIEFLRSASNGTGVFGL